MYRRVRIFECISGPGPRRNIEKRLIWAPWAEVKTNTITRRSQDQEVLQEAGVSLELRRCEMAETIRRHMMRHDRVYRAEIDGAEYEIKQADYDKTSRGKIRLTASLTG